MRSLAFQKPPQSHKGLKWHTIHRGVGQGGVSQVIISVPESLCTEIQNITIPKQAWPERV